MARAVSLLLLMGMMLSFGARARGDITSDSLPERTRQAWLYLDTPLWDLADEGLPFRVSAAWPARRDPLSRFLRVTETRWTGSAGYAKVYNSFDTATGEFRSAGGHAALVSLGRQFLWRLPSVAGRWQPDPMIEAGAHFASRDFPAGGTRFNFKVFFGIEWELSAAAPERDWRLGVVWLHFSNANVLSRNSGFDGLGLRFSRGFTY